MRNTCLSILVVIFLSTSFNVFSHETKSDFHFTENKGQFDDRVQYHTKLHIGDIFFEKNIFTFDLYSPEDLEFAHEYRHLKNSEQNRGDLPITLRKDVYQMHFVGANSLPTLLPENKKQGLKNYFRGNDKSKWVSNARSFKELNYKSLYDYIDVRIYTNHENLKYDFIVRTGGDPSDIMVEYKGVKDLQIKDGGLEIKLSNTSVTELKPFAYQYSNNRKVEVMCELVVNETEVSYRFPNGYDLSKDLIIDPTLIFASLTGSTSDNWGFTATYDLDGNFYGGGIADGSGYPTTTNAYDVSFGSEWDAVITKFNSTGTSLIYSTYLGGDEADQPHSLVTDVDGNLVILGVTSSTNYPTTSGAYDESFNLGNSINEDGIDYNNGTDIFVTKLNSSGSQLLGSTYLGGSSNDGFSLDANLKFNYADHARGEVVLDDNNLIYITSSTNSNNFPTPNGNQQILGGGYDGVVSCFSSDLSSLNWSTFIGGNNGDAGYSIRVDDSNDLVAVCGGTRSNNIGATSGTINPSRPGGTDGYVATFTKSSGSFNALTYLGTNSYDQAYILEIDNAGDIYVTGQTKGSYPVSTGVYSNNNANQFIHKMNNSLTTTDFSTVFGSGLGNSVDISITAFLVDNCKNIYVAGWGGSTNNEGNTDNMPYTTNAIQSTTDGSDFYFIVLERGAQSLLYGTYYGLNGGSIFGGEHVDGGTSRFDKEGTIYQGVCAGCGGYSFPTTPGAWSSSNGSSNCNYGAIKIELDFQGIVANAVNPGNIMLCSSPYIVNLSAGPNPPPSAYWDFGDGNSSADINPTHTYADTGTYQIMYVAIDPSSCNISDTVYFDITLMAAEQFSADFNIPSFDPCDSSLFVQLSFTGTGADSIIWDMGNGTVFINDSVVNYSYTTPGTYTITMTAYDLVCNNTGTISQVVDFNPTYSYAQASVPPNVFSCEPPYEVDFSSTGNPSPPNVFWDFGDGVGTSTLPTITYTYADTGTYQVMYVAIDSNTCNIADTAYFTVQFEQAEEFNATFDIPVLPPCRTSDSLWVQLDFTGSGADSLVWDMGDGTIFINDTILNYLYLQPGDYVISMTAYDFKCNNIGTISEKVQFTGVYEDVFVPNAFTPNGDGNNDVLYVRGLGITEVQFAVYDRWGEKVFETNEQDKGWDGKYEGMLADPGVFVYYLNIVYCDGQKYFEKGNVTLID